MQLCGCSCENVKDIIDSNGITKSSILKMIFKTKFGIYGRQFVPETLMPTIEELNVGNWCWDAGFVVTRFEA
jgi:hypothetical protein